jgi:MlrC C-terminus
MRRRKLLWAAAMLIAGGTRLVGDDRYPAGIAEWRKNYDRDLRSEKGPLWLIARHTVAEGRTEIGSDASNGIQLPGRAPQRVGAIERHGDKGTFEPAAGIAVKLNGKPMSGLAALRTEGGPVVLAESSDSTGSGSPGDSTGVLRHLVRVRLTGPAAIFLVDPASVKAAIQAGVGSGVTLKVGGSLDRKHSKPVRVTGTVKLISDGRWVGRARGYNTGIATCVGRTVVLEVGRVQILMAERSSMTVDPELFRSHGIEPLYCKIVVVKSPKDSVPLMNPSPKPYSWWIRPASARRISGPFRFAGCLARFIPSTLRLRSRPISSNAGEFS